MELHAPPHSASSNRGQDILHDGGRDACEGPHGRMHGAGAPWKPDLGLKTTSTTACSASSFLSWACLGPYTAARTLEESCVHLAEPSARFRRPRSHARLLFERGSVPSSAWRRAAAASVGERTVIGPAAGLEPSQAIKTMGRRQACPLSQCSDLTLTVNGPVCGIGDGDGGQTKI